MGQLAQGIHQRGQQLLAGRGRDRGANIRLGLEALRRDGKLAPAPLLGRGRRGGPLLGGACLGGWLARACQALGVASRVAPGARALGAPAGQRSQQAGITFALAIV